MAGALVTLRGADSADSSALRAAVDEAAAALERALSVKPHFSQSEAAGLLDVTPTTLHAWISKGLLPVTKAPDYKRERIPAGPLLKLATEVKELRRLGRKRGLLVEALSRLEQEDPHWRKRFEELHPSRGTTGEDELVSAAPGPDWDPED